VRPTLTIEEALASEQHQAPARRASKATTTDYARLHEQEEEADFYGETTTSDSGSDGSFLLEQDDWSDDESTLLEAEARELAERRAREESDDDGDDASYYADPDELEKLKEEAEMDVDDVVERFRQEAAVVLPDNSGVPEQVSSEGAVASRRVRFASSNEAAARNYVRQQSNGATTNGDAESDVEDFVHDDDQLRSDHDERDDDNCRGRATRLSAQDSFFSRRAKCRLRIFEKCICPWMVARRVRPRMRVKQNLLQLLQHRRLLALVGHVLAMVHKCRMWKPY
jgi:hypothetical protein